MIFLQAIAKTESPAGACLRLFELGIIELSISEDILTELRDVLNRPSVRRKLRTITDDRVERLLASLRDSARLVEDVHRVFEYPRDLKDEPYINLAVQAQASFLISRDNDLLDLADAASPDGRRLQMIAPQLWILKPERFLEQIQHQTN